ncbi:MAG: hypothetical protein NT027_08235 [Proteobacteria bacterium]|nr:hypothetical protein [Pseudomonadota bacterium]
MFKSNKKLVNLISNRLMVLIFSVGQLFTQNAFGQNNDDVRGLYQAILLHDGAEFYQYAKITLRTVNVGGQLKVGANVKVLFGELDSNEYLTYEYPDVPLNLLTRELSVRQDGNDVSLIGTLKNGILEGEWFSTQVGRVGTFKAQKIGTPLPPVGGVLVKTLSGYYRGKLTNKNPQSNLPERVSMSFVTTQDSTPDGSPSVRVSGNARFYLGGFDSLEYVETPFTNIQFNFYTRYLTAKTHDYGLTIKGTMSPDGQFIGDVLSDGLGKVAELDLNSYP